MSELGLAQSEIAFRQQIQHKKDRYLRVDYVLEIVFPTKQNSQAGGRFWKMVCNKEFGMLYYEDRRPLYCATESRRTATFGLFLGLLETRANASVGAGGST